MQLSQGEMTFKPAYNKYLTRAEIRQNKIRYWKRILYADTPQVCVLMHALIINIAAMCAQDEINLWSLLLWFPRFVKYELVPIQLRYVVWLLLQPFRGVQQRLHRQLVLQGAVTYHRRSVSQHCCHQGLHWTLRSHVGAFHVHACCSDGTARTA